MEMLCPVCQTALVKKHRLLVCPRHDIGECTYDAYQVTAERSMKDDSKPSDRPSQSFHFQP